MSRLDVNNYTFNMDSDSPNYIYSDSLILSIDTSKIHFNFLFCVLCNTRVFHKELCYYWTTPSLAKELCYYWTTPSLAKENKVYVLCNECHNKIFIILSAKLK